MSLLNDMLQDLQQHPDKDHEANDEYNRAQLRESGLIKITTIPWILTAMVFIIVLLVLLIVKQNFGQKKETLTEKIVTSVEKNFPASIHSPESNNLTSLVEPPQESIQPSKNTPTTETLQPAQMPSALTPEQKIQIDQLLMRARQAIARDRLTSPFEDNAYRYYQDTLAIDPGNELATQGLLQLADSYLVMADKKLVEKNMDGAQQFLQRAQLVAPDYSAVTDFAAKIQFALSDQSLEIYPEDATEKATGKENQASAENPIVDEDEAPEPAPESVSIRDPFTTADDTPHLSVAPNLQWQDQQKLEQARLLLQQGKAGQAITALEDFIVSNPGSVESTRLLLDIYCEQQRIDDAQALLASASYFEKADQHYFKARIALANQQPEEAMALLETGLAAAEKNEHYRALLAGIYQKTARYPQAASSYKRLLEVFGEKPAYWLGYALALDAMEQKASALQAYQRLSEYRELQTEVRQYIKQRIAALQG